MPVSYPSLFFQASQSITKRLGELFTFVWSTSAGLWNLRWQVQGYTKAVGQVNHDELNARFIKGSGIYSVDLKSACITSTWEEQQEQFAKFLLFDLCGLYEAWLENVVPKVVSSGDKEIVRKALQFPTSPSSKTSLGIRGLGYGLFLVNQSKSHMLVTDFFPKVSANSKNNWLIIENMLIAYRYFKEARNTFIHSDGIASQEMVDAYNAYKAINYLDLKFKDPPIAPVVTLGSPLSIAFNDVVKLGDLVHRMIATLDAAMMVSSYTENDLLQRLKAAHPIKKKLPVGKSGSHVRKINTMLAQARIPKPLNTVLIEGFMKSHDIIS